MWARGLEGYAVSVKGGGESRVQHHNSGVRMDVGKSNFKRSPRLMASGPKRNCPQFHTTISQAHDNSKHVDQTLAVIACAIHGSCNATKSSHHSTFGASLASELCCVSPLGTDAIRTSMTYRGPATHNVARISRLPRAMPAD